MLKFNIESSQQLAIYQGIIVSRPMLIDCMWNVKSNKWYIQPVMQQKTNKGYVTCPRVDNQYTLDVPIIA